MPTIRRLALLLPTTLALVAGTAPPAHAVTNAALASQVAAVLRDSRVTASTNGTLVADAATGSELAGRNAWQSAVPASNMKIVTAGAALRTLGSGYRFKTEAIARWSVRPDGSVPSSVYLKGYGDPSLMESDLRALAQNLRARGVRRFTGNLVADGSFFDGAYYNSAWGTQNASQYYAPQIAGLSLAPNADFDAGTVIVTAYPTRSGAAARITVTPASAASYVRIVNKVKTGRSSSVGVARTLGTNTITVTGSVATSASGGSRRWVAVHRPDLYAATVFRAQLAAVGITVAGPTVAGVTPAAGRVIVATDTSQTIGELMRPFLKLSNNAIAEHLLKTMGARTSAPGTTAKGVAYLRDYLRAAGAPLTGTAFADGSGLARSNRLTPRALTRALLYAQRQPWFGAFYAGLPVAGATDRMTGGTLSTRMRGTAAAGRVMAKTGSLSGVTSLSGYITAVDGRRYVFSMLSNYRSSSPRPVEDRLAITIASHRR